METQKTSNSKSNSEQKLQFWRYHNFHLQTILQNRNNKNSMVLAQIRQEDQWIRIEDPPSYINPHSYRQLIFDKGAQNTQWKKDSLLKMLLGKLDIHM
jgi:hypothetical protein